MHACVCVNVDNEGIDQFLPCEDELKKRKEVKSAFLLFIACICHFPPCVLQKRCTHVMEPRLSRACVFSQA